MVTVWQNEKLSIMSNFYFCDYVKIVCCRCISTTLSTRYQNDSDVFMVDVPRWLWKYGYYQLNPFPHTTILQKTLWTYLVKKQKISIIEWITVIWLKVENIVTKGEIARFVQFLLLLLCFQKAVCWRGVRKRLYEGKG